MDIKKKWAFFSLGALTVAAGSAFFGTPTEEREAVTLSADAKARLGSQQNPLSLMNYGSRAEVAVPSGQVVMVADDHQVDNFVKNYDVHRDAKKIWELMSNQKNIPDDDTYKMYANLAEHLMRDKGAYVDAGIPTYDFSLRMSQISQGYMRDKKAQYKGLLAEDELFYAYEALVKIEDASVYVEYDGFKKTDSTKRFDSVQMTESEVAQSLVKLESALAKLALSEVKEQWVAYSGAHTANSKGQILSSLQASLANMNRYAGQANTMSGGNFALEDIGTSRGQYLCYQRIIKSQFEEKEFPAALPPMSTCPS